MDFLSLVLISYSSRKSRLCSKYINGSTRRPGLWKLNTSLLKDPKIVLKLKERLNQWKSLQELYSSVGDWWQDLEIRIKNFLLRKVRK